VHVNVFAADFAGEHFGSFPLAWARAVFQVDVPTVPIANNLAELDDPFTQRKSEVGTQIFHRIDAIVPTEERNLQTSSLYSLPQSFCLEFFDTRNSNPFSHSAIPHA
jgi:hypothetical protein